MYVKGGLSSFVNISHIFHNCATHAHSRSEMQAVTSQCLHMAACNASDIILWQQPNEISQV